MCPKFSLSPRQGGVERVRSTPCDFRIPRPRGNASIARELILPLRIGENLNGPAAMLEALDVEACDYVMPDLARFAA